MDQLDGDFELVLHNGFPDATDLETVRTVQKDRDTVYDLVREYSDLLTYDGRFCFSIVHTNGEFFREIQLGSTKQIYAFERMTDSRDTNFEKLRDLYGWLLKFYGLPKRATDCPLGAGHTMPNPGYDDDFESLRTQLICT